MPFRFDTEDEQEERKRRRPTATLGQAAGSDTEIALGTRSLLAIFFGLVLICSVFFGLGYSMGRAGGARAPEQPATETASAPDSHLSKPSPGQSLEPVEAPAETANEPQPPPNASEAGTASATTSPSAGTQASAPAQKPVNPFQSPTPSTSTPSAASPATLQQASATVSTNFMVQVAAVRVPQDAQILVDALKRHGYSAVVRNEPQDQLLHVQLGPYPVRGDAMAMRARLLSDGYNAVVK